MSGASRARGQRGIARTGRARERARRRSWRLRRQAVGHGDPPGAAPRRRELVGPRLRGQGSVRRLAVAACARPRGRRGRPRRRGRSRGGTAPPAGRARAVTPPAQDGRRARRQGEGRPRRLRRAAHQRQDRARRVRRARLLHGGGSSLAARRAAPPGVRTPRGDSRRSVRPARRADAHGRHPPPRRRLGDAARGRRARRARRVRRRHQRGAGRSPPEECAVLEYELEPWTVADSLAIELYATWALVARDLAAQAAGGACARERRTRARPLDRAAGSRAGPRPRADPRGVAPHRPAPGRARSRVARRARAAAATAGRSDATGRAPERPWSRATRTSARRCRARCTSRTSRRPASRSPAPRTSAGPIIQIGRNRHCAWGITNFSLDDVDCVVEEVDGIGNFRDGEGLVAAQPPQRAGPGQGRREPEGRRRRDAQRPAAVAPGGAARRTARRDGRARARGALGRQLARLGAAGLARGGARDQRRRRSDAPRPRSTRGRSR